MVDTPTNADPSSPSVVPGRGVAMHATLHLERRADHDAIVLVISHGAGSRWSSEMARLHDELVLRVVVLELGAADDVGCDAALVCSLGSVVACGGELVVSVAGVVSGGRAVAEDDGSEGWRRNG